MLNETYHKSEMIQSALRELRPEIEAARSQPLPQAPTLHSTLEELGPLPREALLLGLAADGLPVLLNLHDPRPGPLLVVGDPGAGKTALLQLIAEAGTRMHPAGELQFGVVTNYPEEWSAFEGQPHCAGVFPTYQNRTIDFLRALSSWAHHIQAPRKAVLLLVDDLESMDHLDFEHRQILRWLLLRGPVRRVWPIVSANAGRLEHVQPWMEAFRTYLFGRIRDDRTARAFCGHADASFASLYAGYQFAIREDAEWLKFWIPQV